MNPCWLLLPGTRFRIRFWSNNLSEEGVPYTLNFRVFDCNEGVLVTKEQFTAFDWEKESWQFDGFLKWDGCISWLTPKNSYIHGCGPDHVEDITKLFTAIYWVGEKYMPGEFDQLDPPEGCVIVELD